MQGKPWPHSPYHIATKEILLGPNNIARTYEVYLDGALKYSGPTYEKAFDFCTENQGKVGGR